jgi:hypothetical protein
MIKRRPEYSGIVAVYMLTSKDGMFGPARLCWPAVTATWSSRSKAKADVLEKYLTARATSGESTIQPNGRSHAAELAAIEGTPPAIRAAAPSSRRMLAPIVPQCRPARVIQGDNPMSPSKSITPLTSAPVNDPSPESPHSTDTDEYLGVAAEFEVDDIFLRFASVEAFDKGVFTYVFERALRKSYRKACPPKPSSNRYAVVEALKP